MHKQNFRIDNKIRFLMKKYFTKKCQNFKPIRYKFWMRWTHPKKSLNVSPDKFSSECSLNTLQRNWFVNLSDIEIFMDVQRLL